MPPSPTLEEALQQLRAHIEADGRLPDVDDALALARAEHAEEVVMHADADALAEWADNFILELTVEAARAPAPSGGPNTTAAPCRIACPAPGCSKT